MTEKTKTILRNDPAKKRKFVNFQISEELQIDIKEIQVRESRKRGKQIKLMDLMEEIVAKGVREWRNL